ncbi:uridylate kinase, partial [Ophiobolus disseminans]
CTLLSQSFYYAHLSVGDLLRAEAIKPSSPHAATIRENMRLGRVGPKEITVGALQASIREEKEKEKAVQGFRRKWIKRRYFEEVVAPIDLVIVFECDEVVVVERLAGRGRADDDAETIKKRIKTFKTTTGEVLEKYDTLGKVVKVKSDGEKEDVYARLKEVLGEKGVILEAREKNI